MTTMKFAGNPVLYNIDIVTPPVATENWLDVTNLDGNNDPYWYGQSGTVYADGVWTRGTSQQIRLGTFIVEGPTVPFWETNIPKKFRVTFGANHTGAIEPTITLYGVIGDWADSVPIVPDAVTVFDNNIVTYSAFILYSDCDIIKIEVVI